MDYKPKQRTVTQNSSLHLGFEIVAKACREKGITMNAIFEKARMEHETTAEAIKYDVFHRLMRSMYHIDSTTKLKKIGQIENVWDAMMKFLGENFELEYIDFPHEEKPEDKTGYHK